MLRTTLWETDGIRVLEFNWSAEQIQFTCSVKPTVSPTFFTARMKGRLQHAFRVAETPTAFSGKVDFARSGRTDANKWKHTLVGKLRRNILWMPDLKSS